jgi:hypothetical protein
MGQVLGCSYAIMNRKTWKEIKFKNNFFSVWIICPTWKRQNKNSAIAGHVRSQTQIKRAHLKCARPMKQTLFCIAREELELAKMDLRRFYATLKIDLWKTKKSTWDGVKGELEMLPTLSLELARPLSCSSSCSMKMNLCVRLSMTFFMRQDRSLSQTWVDYVDGDHFVSSLSYDGFCIHYMHCCWRQIHCATVPMVVQIAFACLTALPPTNLGEEWRRGRTVRCISSTVRTATWC